MNWTGGSLQRTKNANKGVVQKQKAYFAKARTHLQNGPDSPIAPFRPSYLQNDDSFELVGHLPSCGTGSVRHTGHAARRYRDETDQEFSPRARRKETTEHAKDSPRFGSLEEVQQPTRITARTRKHERRDKREADSDSELQLLEANKKRLLRHNDWIGVALSRPLNLRFMSSREKGKMGRRRRVEGRPGATARHRDNGDLRMPAAHLLNDLEHVALHRPEDIRIRIGTDALTTACPTQPEHPSYSHASSEPMLFDQQTPENGRSDERDALHTDTYRLSDVHAMPDDNSAIDPDTVLSDEQNRSPRIAPHPARSVSNLRDPSLLHTWKDRTALASPESFAGENSSRANSLRAPRIVQQVEGATHPLRLVFRDSVSSPDDSRRDVVLNGGEALDTAYAGDSQTGTMHAFGSGPEHQSESEAIAAAAIVDEKPWKALLDLSEQSSSHARFSTPRQPEERIAQHQAIVQRREKEQANWSQHATQGNEMYSSSMISASLPSLKRGYQTRVPARPLEGHSDHWNKRDSRELNEDEKRWEVFIFGSDEVSSSGKPNDRRESSAHRASQNSSGYLPLSAAVSSMRSTPFSKTPRRISRMSDSIQNATRFAPHATTAGFIEELSDQDQDHDQDQGNRTADRSTSGEQSVTHVSMENNVSGETDLISSRMLSSTETSRGGLERAGYAADGLFARAQASSNEMRRKVKRRSVRDSPDSDEGGIHLVDRNIC